MGTEYDVVDLTHRTRFELGKGPWYPLAETVNAGLEPDWNVVREYLSGQGRETIVEWLRAFIEHAGGSARITNDFDDSKFEYSSYPYVMTVYQGSLRGMPDGSVEDFEPPSSPDGYCLDHGGPHPCRSCDDADGM